jgi:hypothetical protein
MIEWKRWREEMELDEPVLGVRWRLTLMMERVE